MARLAAGCAAVLRARGAASLTGVAQGGLDTGAAVSDAELAALTAIGARLEAIAAVV